jgi:alkylation response protein AidB-like acyl-CoA dehydrogenase
MLDLEFSQEQELLRGTVRELLGRHCPLSVVREMEDDPLGYPAELWERLGGLDLVGLLLPQEWGGSGMTLVEGVALYEELGRALAPVPHFVSAVLSGSLLALSGSEEQKREWLPRVASGAAVITPAWLEPGNGFGPEGVQVRAEARGDGYLLEGVKRHVAFAAAADRLLVLARTGEEREDIGLFLVDPASPGVELAQQLSLASDTQYRVSFSDVFVPAACRVGSAGWQAWRQVAPDAQVLLAAQAVGGARYALDITVQYAKDRRQFDKPLGAFQAISHYLADAATAVDGAEQLVHEAASARAKGRGIELLGPMSKLFACRVFRDVTATAQQVFGGIGFTVEFDIQLYFRRAKQLQIGWWDTRALEEEVAAAVLD